MKEQKQNDWFLESTLNPSFTVTNFKDVGLTADNTSLLSELTYKNIPFVREMELFLTDGKFDEAKFHQYYLASALMYNNFTNDKFVDTVHSELMRFGTFDIWADPAKRSKGAAESVSFERVNNPMRQSSGIIRLGRNQESPLSMREIAEQLKVLLNPVEASNDPSKALWGEAPDNGILSKGFWTSMLDTRVLAQWDENGEHIDPVTGKKVLHKKGELKTNEYGVNYYENLDGRDIYGRQVLSKMDTITREGSWANKYDFFDSDDKNKSVTGTVFKTLATIAPMFIPFIGPYYTALGIGLELMQIGSVLGKMFVGSDSPKLSAIEGFATLFSTSKSDYASEHPWSAENMIGMIGDVFKQLAQQRWLFQAVPGMVKGTGNLYDKEKYLKVYNDLVLSYTESSVNTLATLAQSDKLSAKAVAGMKALAGIKPNMAMENLMESYNNIGKWVSLAYMTGITVKDAYGEAKLLGASDLEATALMLGYAAGEFAILNTGLGEWIMPELRMLKLNWKRVAEALAENPYKDPKIGKSAAAAAKEAKYKWVNKLFNIGKSIANADYSTAKSLGISAAANSLGEGLEEVSEEVWADASKSIFNLAAWLAGSDTKLKPTWAEGGFTNTLNDYALNFVGGAIGGGLMSFTNDYKLAKSIRNSLYNADGSVDKSSAFLHLVYMARNNELNEFRETVNNMTLGNKYLSSKPITEDGLTVYGMGTDDDNLDLYLKQKVNALADFVENTLKAQGASLSDDSVLRMLDGEDTLGELRFMALRDSGAAARYLSKWNDLDTKIVAAVANINNLSSPAARGTSEQTSTNETNTTSALTAALLELTRLLEEKNKFLDGTFARLFIQEGIFEMSDAVSGAYGAVTLTLYIEAVTNTPIKEVNSEEIDRLKADYDKYRKGELKDKMPTMYNIHKNIALKFNPFLSSHIEKSFAPLSSDVSSDLKLIQQIIKGLFTGSSNTPGLNISNPNFLEEASRFTFNMFQLQSLGILLGFVNKYGTLEEKEAVNIQLDALSSSDMGEDFIYSDEFGELRLTLTEVAGRAITDIVQEVKELGFINPELKTALYGVVATMGEANGSLYELLDDIEGLRHTDTVELLDLFAVTIKNDTKVSNLLLLINLNLQNANGDIELFELNSSDITAIDESLLLIKLLEAQVLSARKDATDIDNIWGLNTTINQMDPEAKLTEIDKNLADAIVEDLGMIKRKLLFAKDVILSNQALKLTELQKAGDIILITAYKAIKDLMNIPSDWEGADELKSKLEGLSTLSKYSENLGQSLDKTVRKKLTEETRALSNAIYDFFHKEGNLARVADEKELAKIFERINLLSHDNPAMGSHSEYMGGLPAAWWIASRASVKSDDFYHTLKLTLDNNLIAALPGLIESVYLGYSMIIRGNEMRRFAKAINEAVHNQIQALTTSSISGHEMINGGSANEELLSLIKLYSRGSDYNILFDTIAFIEGMPGTGKTLGVYRTIINMLKLAPENSPTRNLLSNVWIVHNTKESAQKLAAELGLENASCFGINDIDIQDNFYKKITNGTWKREYNPDGTVKVEESDWDRDGRDNTYHSSLSTINLKNPPSMILIDEVSNHTLLDMDLTKKFADSHGVPVLVGGDLLLSKAYGRFKPGGEGSDVNVETFLFRNYFPTASRLGVILRPSNNLMALAVLKMLVVRDALGKKTPNISVDLNYCENAQTPGLYGVKRINGTTEYSNLNIILSNIDKLIETSTGPIGFIYLDNNSKLYKTLTTSPKYSSKIIPYKGNSALGLEGQYYIIEDTPSVEDTIKNGKKVSEGNYDKYWGDVYTAISRAKQGVLWVSAPNTPNLIQNGDEIQTQAVPNVVILSEDEAALKKEVIARFNLEQKELFDLIYTEGTMLEYLRRQLDKNIQTVEETIPLSGQEEDLSTLTTSGGLVQLKRMRSITFKASATGAPKPEAVNTGGAFNLIHYTQFTKETGMRQDKNGNLQLHTGDDAKYRKDNLNGILSIKKKYYPGGVSSNKVTSSDRRTLHRLLKLALTETDNTKLLNEFVTRLGIATSANPNPKVYLRWAYISHSRELIPEDELRPDLKDGKKHYRTSALNTDKFAKFNRYYDELLGAIHSDARRGLLVRNHTISLIFGTYGDGGKACDELEIPILSTPNPVTLLKDPTLSAIKQEYDNISARLGDVDLFKKLTELMEWCRKNSSVPGAENMANLILVHTATSNFVAFLGDSSFNLASLAKNLGMTILTEEKGADYEDSDDFIGGGKWMSLKDFAEDPYYVVSPIKISATGTMVVPGQALPIEFALPGHPFVLVSDDPDLTPDNIVDRYRYEIMHPDAPKTVVRIYVTPPRYSLLEYFENLSNILNKNGLVQSIGDHFTAYRILSAVFNHNKADKLENINKKELDTLRSKVEALDMLEVQAFELEKLMTALLEEGTPEAEAKIRELRKQWKDILTLLFTMLVSKGYYLGKQQSLKDGLQGLLGRIYNINTVEDATTPEGEEERERVISEKKALFIAEFLELLLKGLNPITHRAYNFDGIYFNPSFDRTNTSDIVNADNGGVYTINGRDYEINGKIDLPAYSIDFSQILRTIVGKLTYITKNGTKIARSSDTPLYLDGVSGNSFSNVNMLENILKSKDISINSAIKDKVRKHFSDPNKVTKEDILKFLQEEGHLVIDLFGTTLVSELNDEIKGKTINIQVNGPITSESIPYLVTLDSEQWQATLKLDLGHPQTFTLHSKISQELEGPGKGSTQPQVDMSELLSMGELLVNVNDFFKSLDENPLYTNDAVTVEDIIRYFSDSETYKSLDQDEILEVVEGEEFKKEYEENEGILKAIDSLLNVVKLNIENVNNFSPKEEEACSPIILKF